MNRSGYILEFPNVASMAALLDGSPTLNPYAQSATQEFPLGTKLIQGERTWRYTLNGAGTPGPGTVLQTAIVNHAEDDLDLVVDATTAIGAFTISLTSTTNGAVAANFYKEGYAFINTGLGFGSVYKIRSHAALVGTAAGSIFTLYDPLVVASTIGNSLWGLRKNVYDSVIASAAAMSGVPVGVNMLTLTASYYFWMQTSGPACILTHAAIDAGHKAMAGTTAAQIDPSVDNMAALSEIGWPISICDAAGQGSLVFLTLDH